VYPVLLAALHCPFLSARVVLHLRALKQGPSRETSNTGNTR
jgi:hypothetical protein